MSKNPLSNSLCYYPEFSSVEQEKREMQERRKIQKLNEEAETYRELTVLLRISLLPEDIKRYIGAFSPVVLNLKQKIKYEFFYNWSTENVMRIFSILESWPKQNVGFVLNRIFRLEFPETNMYLMGDDLYKHYTAKHMRGLIILEINNRCKTRDRNLAEKLQYTRYHEGIYIPCLQNPAIDNYSSVRVWGAYKAIEEYDRRLKSAKKTKIINNILKN